MAIKDFYVESRTINFPGGSFKVEGVSFDHLVKLFTEARDDMLGAMEMYDGLAESGEVNTMALAMAAIDKFPNLVATLIATAANEPGTEETVRAMPFPVQTEALVAIGELTFTEVEALKKFLGHLALMMEGAKKLTQTDSTSGTAPAIGG